MRSYDPAVLETALEAVGLLSAPSDGAKVKVHHGYRQTQNLEPFRFVLDDFEPVKSAWLSWMEPGAWIRPHIDASPWFERWQIPIRPAGRFTQGGEPVEQATGVPFQVKHWTEHEVVNDTDRPRVHLVIDRDVLAQEGTAAFFYREG